jgi:hypothetical protein
MKDSYKKLASQIGLMLSALALLGLVISCYDRFTTVEAMAKQSVTDRTEDMEQISSDLSEIKSMVKDTNDKLDSYIIKSR